MKTILLLLLTASLASAELIPAVRLTDWTPGTKTGVIGGIDQYLPGGVNQRTQLHNVVTENGADNTGATDATAAIQAGIDLCPVGHVVYLPAGTYKILGTLIININSSNRTIRGAGPAVTIIDQHSNVGMEVGSSVTVGPPNVTPLRVTSGLTSGSTTVTVDGSTADILTDMIIFLYVKSDLTTLPVVSPYLYDVETDQAPMKQAVRVVSKTSSTITFSPPLFEAYGGGTREVRIERMLFQVNNFGIEDLTFDATNFGGAGAYTTVRFSSVYGSWVKNCNLIHVQSYPFVLANSLNCEVRHSKLQGLGNTGSNAAGIVVGAWSCLVEDNIVVDVFPNLEVNDGSAGNVFGYNCGSPDGNWDSNHAAHNQYNLYEGNAVGYTQSDGYWGSEANITLFRNYYQSAAIGASLKRWTRNASLVGNYFNSPNTGTYYDGTPNMGNAGCTGTAQLSQGDPWANWQMSGPLTTRTSDSEGVITASSGYFVPPQTNGVQVMRLVWGAGHDQSRFAQVQSVSGVGDSVGHFIDWSGGTALPAEGTMIYIGPGNNSMPLFQELDLDVAATTIRKGNRYALEPLCIDYGCSPNPQPCGVGTYDSLGGDTLPTSLYRSSRPSWFFGLTWPPFDPVTPRIPSIEHIPSGYRYVHNVDPPSGTSFLDPIDSTTGTIVLPFVSSLLTSPHSVSQPAVAPNPGDAKSGTATYTFTVTSGLGGFYSLSALVDFPNDNASSFWVNIDFQPSIMMIWTGALTSGFQSRTVTRDVGPAVLTRRFYLSVGQHTIYVKGHDLAKLGTLQLTPAL